MIILFPTELEAAPFRALCPDAAVEICGVGMAQTAACVARLLGEEYRRFLLAGIAGAYSDELAKGDVVAVREERVAGIPTQFDKVYGATLSLDGLREVCANSVCRCGADGCGADVENMEGAALFAVAEAMGLCAVQIRAISNRVGESFEKWHIEEALVALTGVLKNI